MQTVRRFLQDKIQMESPDPERLPERDLWFDVLRTYFEDLSNIRKASLRPDRHGSRHGRLLGRIAAIEHDVRTSWTAHICSLISVPYDAFCEAVLLKAANTRLDVLRNLHG